MTKGIHSLENQEYKISSLLVCYFIIEASHEENRTEKCVSAYITERSLKSSNKHKMQSLMKLEPLLISSTIIDESQISF